VKRCPAPPRGGRLAHLLRAHGVAQGRAHHENGEDVARVAHGFAAQPLVQLIARVVRAVGADVLIRLANVLRAVDAVAEGGARAGACLLASQDSCRRARLIWVVQ